MGTEKFQISYIYIYRTSLDGRGASNNCNSILVINNKFNQVRLSLHYPVLIIFSFNILYIRSNVISSNDRMISTLLFCLFSINFPKTRYLQQVLNESMRLSALIPWAAKVQDLDIELGGHIIPKGVSETSRSKH